MPSIDLPKLVEVEDHHDFFVLQRQYRLLLRSIKVREINSNPENGRYIGMVYVGNLKSLKNRILLRKEEKRLKKIHDDFDWSNY